MRSMPWLVVLCLVAGPAFAQDDDLAPLVPTKAAPKKAPRPRAPKKQQPPKEVKEEEDDLAPLSVVGQKSELWVKGQAGALLSIDGKEVGPLPQPAQALAPGEHQVLVKRRGWAVYVKKVQLAAGKTVELTATLQALNAVLAVTSDVAGADVLVNGRVVGVTPLAELELPASTVELEIRKDDYKPAKQRLVLLAGREYPVSVKLKSSGAHTVLATLEPAETDAPLHTTLAPAEVRDTGPTTVAQAGPSQPIYQRWYFWAGVGAVVVGAGIATGVAVGNGQKAPQPPSLDVACNGAASNCSGSINFPPNGHAAGILPYANGIRF